MNSTASFQVLAANAGDGHFVRHLVLRNGGEHLQRDWFYGRSAITAKTDLPAT